MNDIAIFFEVIDPEKLVWLASLTAGAFLFLYGCAYCFKKGLPLEKRFSSAALLEFAASWILHLPGELFSDPQVDAPVLRVLEAVSTAFLKALTLYGGEGYERIVYEGHPYFTSIYGILRVFVNIALLLFVGGFILEFMDSPLQSLKLFFRKKAPLYLFSGINKETLSIAATIPAKPGPGKSNLVFACADRDAGKENVEEPGNTSGPGNADRTDDGRLIHVELTPAEVLAKVKKHTPCAEIFLFGGTESERLLQLDGLLTELKKEDTPQKLTVRIYIEIKETPWRFHENAAQNMLQGRKNVVVNYVCTEENFAFDYLLKHSIFDNAQPAGADREIRAAIIGGMNARNLELLKVMLHLSQMPGYRLKMLVMDDGAGRDRLRQLMPEIYDECSRPGDAVYSLDYREHVDLETDRLETILEKEYPDLALAFVNTEDDLRNVTLAQRIRALWKRKGRAAGEYRISMNIREPRILSYLDPDLIRDLDPVGGTADTFSYASITMPDIERASKAIHEVRYGGSKSWEEYCGSEYSRHSVYARTLSFKYKVRLIDKQYGSDYEIVSKDRLWKMYEHMRWNVYTRTLGYRRADPAVLKDGKLDRDIRLGALVHDDLVPFEELPEAVQEQDGLTLTGPVVEILKSI